MRVVEPVVDMKAFVNPFAVRRSVTSTTSAMTARRPAAGPPTLQPSPGTVAGQRKAPLWLSDSYLMRWNVDPLPDPSPRSPPRGFEV